MGVTVRVTGASPLRIGVEKTKWAGGGSNTGVVTPEQYGAAGDGVTDDAPALKAALESGKPVVLTQDLHLFSTIVTRDKDVFLDGQGHTLFLHGADMDGNTASGGTGGQCIDVGATWNEGTIDDADVVIYTEDAGYNPTNPAFPERSWYRRGYLSYHGFNPTPDKEVYEHYTTRSWREVRVDFRNVNFVGDHTDGLKYLRLNLVCNSNVDNCTFLCTTIDGAAIGVKVDYGYNVMLTRIRCEGFTCNTARSILSTGYGIQAIGDAILISNCIMKNCKNHINIGGGSGNSGIFTTGAIIDNVVLQTTDTGEYTADGSDDKLYQQMLDLHEGCHHPIINNVILEYENAMGEDNWGTMIHLSCPEATVSNVFCRFQQAYGGPDGSFAICYFGFGPLVKRMEFNNVHAQNCYLFPHGWSYESGSAYSANYIREIRINGGEIGGIYGDRKQASGLVKVRLNNVRIGGSVRCAHLYADSCVFKNENQMVAKEQIEIEQEGFFTNCDIWGYTLGGYRKSKPLIKAPPNSVWMTNCILRKPLDVQLFKTEQTHLVNNAIYDLYGLVLGSKTSEVYSDGDECELDKFNLW